MSTVNWPKVIDPVQIRQGLANQGFSHAERVISITEFERLLRIANKPDTDVSAKINWGVDASGRPLICGEISCHLTFLCQRCLAEFQMPFSKTFSLLVEYAKGNSEPAQADQFRRLDEGTLILDVGEVINVYDLIEDEILLGLPTHIKHDDVSECDQSMLDKATEYTTGSDEQRKNPFEALKNLKTLE